MACLFSGINSYHFSQNVYISCFLITFCNETVVVICSMLAIAIQNLALKWNNKELNTRKVKFDLSQQVKKKQQIYKYLLYPSTFK